MTPYPHHYEVSAHGASTGPVEARAQNLPALTTTPPPEFGGPAGFWSPETLLCAAVADCFILTFRAVSRAARIDWTQLDCHVTGTLERVEGASQFTRFHTRVELTVPAGVDVAQATAALEKAEHGCLVANSLKGARTLDARVVPGLVPESKNGN